MPNLTRRDAVRTLAVLAAGATLPALGKPNQPGNPRPDVPRAAMDVAPALPARSVPLVHLTDLYNPPQDPDDHVDLATVMALPEYDLRAVVLDVTEKFLVAKPAGWDITRDPGYVPVAQLGYLTGRAIPTAIGPVRPLSDPGDAARDRPRAEQAGIALLLDVLARSPEPVTLSVVGSARVLAAAFNRDPALVKAKTRVVLLNAGATGGTKREWNVGLDPAAYVAVARSGLPIDWFPCATGHSAFDPVDERGTFYRAPHARLFRDLPDGLRGWFGYALTGSNRGDIIHALADTGRDPAWMQLMAGERNLWATASLIMGAGRVLAQTPAGWRFVPAASASGLGQWPLRLDAIEASVADDARISWKQTAGPSPFRLFGRKPGVEYGAAMTEALNALLCRLTA